MTFDKEQSKELINVTTEALKMMPRIMKMANNSTDINMIGELWTNIERISSLTDEALFSEFKSKRA